MKTHKTGIYIASERNLWPHEMHTAKILAAAGYYVEFLLEGNLKTPDVKLNGIEYEIKAPETSKTSSLEQCIRKALKQSPNVIIDSYRMKMRDDKARNFLVRKCREQKQIKKMLYITKKGKILDIKSML